MLPDIFYTLFAGGEQSLRIDASLTDIYGIFPLGRGETAFQIAARSLQEHVEKFEQAGSSAILLAQAAVAAASDIQLSPAGILLQAHLDGVEMRRYRKLSELDPFSGAEIDMSTLQDLSYIVL